MEPKLIYETHSNQLYQDGIGFLTMVSKLIKKEPFSIETGIERYELNNCILTVYYSGEKNQINATGLEENINTLDSLVKRLKSAEVFPD